MDQAVKERRFRGVAITPELLQEWMTEGWQIPNGNYAGIKCVEGLPEDAVYVSAYTHASRDVVLVFAHPSWNPVPKGREPFCMTASYETKYDPEFVSLEW